jgi:hypothetical protein
MTSGFFTLIETYHAQADCGSMNFRPGGIRRADVATGRIGICKSIKPKVSVMWIRAPGEGWQAEFDAGEGTSSEPNSAMYSRASY